jgi:tRNA nucleotidyltransferase (CCA-adding enzyme)
MMSVFQTIRNEVLDQIRPTKTEIETSSRIFSKLEQAIHSILEKDNVEVSFINLEGSSGRKQTQLRNRRELDIFIGLPVSLLTKSIDEEKPKKPVLRKLLRQLVEEVGIEAVKEAGCSNWQVSYAEHPYISAVLEGYKTDIVFGFDLTSEYILENGPITAVDRTPHHSHFVESHLSKSQRDDVRLLKAFFHSAYVYGDTSPVGRSGFTGFSTEMIIYHCRNYTSAFEFLSQPTPKTLDFFSQPPQKLTLKFRGETLIIIDPTDPNRNVASSISERAYRFAQFNANRFLQEPSASFFKWQPIPVLSSNDLERIGENYFVIEFDDKTGWHYTKTRDKLYRYFTKLQKFLSYEATGEPRFGSVIFEEVFEPPHFVIALFVEKHRISETFTRMGPPLDMPNDVEQFVKKHPDAYLQDGRYHVRVQRNFQRAKDAIQDFLINNKVSRKLTPISVSHRGSTLIGKQALWILRQAVQPFIS